MHHKSEAFEKFQKYKVEAEKQLGIYIKQFQSDRGGESGELKSYLAKEGIIYQLPSLGTPQKNGVSKQRNETLLDMVRSMLNYSSLL